MLGITYIYLPSAQKKTDFVSHIPSEKNRIAAKTKPAITPEENTVSEEIVTETIIDQDPIIEGKIVEEGEEVEEIAEITEITEEHDSGLSSLDNSDEMALNSSQKLTSNTRYKSLIIKQEMIRNFVVFVDNFSKGELALQFSPLIRPHKPFTAIKTPKTIFLHKESYNRYNIYANYINSIDIPSAIEQYKSLKPLIDEAYQEIGRPNTDFLDVIDDAINLALKTPVLDGVIRLTSQSVIYKFEDKNLEKLPAAQKLLMRMGPKNLRKVKAKLREFQASLRSLK